MRYKCLHVAIIVLCLISTGILYAEDTEINRRTLAGLQGVCVMIEDFQPNVKQYADSESIDKAQIQKDIEQKLKVNGIKVLSGSEWLKTPGRPVLYVNINTHPSEAKSLISKLLSDRREEKALFAFDIKVELRQVVYLEANPNTKTLSGTWSMNMTGLVNVTNLAPLKTNMLYLVDRFINAYKSVNRGK